MDERDGRILIIGMAAIGGLVIYQGIRIKRTINALDKLADVVLAKFDAEFQEEVDEAFEEIVENYDD